MKAFPAMLGLACILAMAGCTSSGVVPIGGDAYMISRNGTAISAGSNVKAELYKEADKWCRERKLVMVPLEETATDGIAGVRIASAEIKFRAVPPDQVPAGPRRDKNGLTASDYDQLAKQFDAEGKAELALAARERAATLR